MPEKITTETRTTVMKNLEEALQHAKEKHGIKKSEAYMSEEDFLRHEQQQLDRHEQMIKSMKWDDEEESQDENESISVSLEITQDAVNSIFNYVIDNISIADFKPETYNIFDVKVPNSVHSLLPSLFDKKVDEESRYEVFDSLNVNFSETLPRFAERLNKKISETMSPKGEWELEVDGVKINSNSVTKLSDWTICDGFLEMNDDISVGVTVGGGDVTVKNYVEGGEKLLSVHLTLNHKANDEN